MRRTGVLQVMLVAAVWACAAPAAAPFPAAAQEPAPGVGRAPKLDLSRLGELPARFNGRVTTWDNVARAYAARVSGPEVFPAGRDDESAALRWMLDLYTRPAHAQDTPLLPIADPELCALMGVRAPAARGEAGGWFSIGSLRPAFGRLDEAARRAANFPASQRSAFDAAALDLHGRVVVVITLVNTASPLNVAAADGDDQAARVRANLELEAREHEAGPLLVPPEHAGDTWQTLARAGLEVELATAANGAERLRAERPAFWALARCMSAYATADQAAMDRHAAELRRHVSALPRAAGAGAFDFTAPAGWVEVGARIAPGTDFYADSRAFGRAVAVLEFARQAGPADPGAAPRVATVRVDHFTTPVAPVEDLVNAWRYNQRLLPVAAERPREHVRELALGAGAGGGKAHFVDITGAAGALGEAADRSLSVILRRGGHTFVVSLYGPSELVGAQLAEFRAFVGSLRLGTPEELAAWFPATVPRPPPPIASLNAVLRDGERVWCARLTGPAPAVAARAAAFGDFVRSWKLNAAGREGPILIWGAMPPGWSLGPWSERTYLTLLAGDPADGAAFPVEVTALRAPRHEPLLPMVNLWRATSDLPPLADEAQLDRVVERVDAGGREVLVFRVDPAAAAK